MVSSGVSEPTAGDADARRSADLTGAPARASFAPRNRLLASLPPEDLLNLRAHLVRMPLVPGTVLLEPDRPIRRVYFIETGAVSIAATFRDGGTPEMATVGREGLVGVTCLLGGQTPLGRHLVQAAGSALALDAARFQGALRAMAALRVACQAYALAFLGQAFQTAACNSVHTVEERCARWLLMSHDRSDGDTFALTHEFQARTLGLCRSTVTVAARLFQRAGLIRYSRGALTVLDRPCLETASCECYRAIRDHFERLLPHTYERSLQRTEARARRAERAVPYAP